VQDFVQRSPSDGEPASFPTEVYLAYDDKNLYVVFVAFDSEPEKLRARLGRRENLSDDDDWVEVAIDTFNDQRRGYMFGSNPLGVQWDALWSEADGEDPSFDTLWYSRGQVTDQGYVVWMAIPFKSLRFSSDSQQTWGVLLSRWSPRTPEWSAWPQLSSRIQGRLNQAARLEGLENISSGKNIQLIPYGTIRSFRALDSRDPDRPAFVRDRADLDAGLDAKFVLKDSLVVDVTLNPDFAQVESDEPQTTANQRFEVFFPEKRPFFLENANFFETPINLVFTRRIADPQFGVRLTGKTGPYALGALLIDDQSPGKAVTKDSPLHDKRALFGIVRVSRDILNQSSIGMAYTDREFEDSYNRIGGLDGRLRLNNHWVARFQGVTSWTRSLDGETLAGPAYDFFLDRSGRQFTTSFEFNDRSPNFRTLSGFVNRTDIRRVDYRVSYSFRPEEKLISWGPSLRFNRVWDHSGTRLDWFVDPSLGFDFQRQTSFGVFYNSGEERLRPQDFPGLTENIDFSRNIRGVFFNSSAIPQVSVNGDFGWGTGINFVPPAGQVPVLANLTQGEFGLTLRPVTQLRVDNTYTLFRLRDRTIGAAIFNNHIIRSKWNWQFNRELSLRFIVQYDTVLANPEFTVLPTHKSLNADILITYLVNPWTALFVGYNGNAQNIELVPTDTGSAIVRNRNRFINDAKQLFVKFSYLIRF
jgi:hypothetical protein